MRVVWSVLPIPGTMAVFKHIKTSRSTTAFDTLPREVQDLVISHLDPATLVSFRQSCRRFYHTVPLSQHLHEVEMLDKHRANFACALCRTVKPETAFALRQITGDKRKIASVRCVRFCESCGESRKFCNSYDLGHDEYELLRTFQK